ncbi:MAG: helix-turn-helix domain-containing protein [Thermoguttaceae bacterium]
MAQEYYNLERTAEVLKLTPGEVNRMREQSQIRAFRDGSNWKFRKEDVEAAYAEMIKRRNKAAEAELDEDELSLGDLEDSLSFGGDDDEEDQPTMLANSAISEDDGLELALDDIDDGLSLDLSEDSAVPALGNGSGINLSKNASDINLAGAGSDAEDDDIVLGTPSDLKLTSDSSISLVDDSGDSYDVSIADDDVLELDEDSDILAISSEDSELPTMLSEDGGNEFELVAEADGDDDLDSSSQVISLEGEDSPFGGFGDADLGSADMFSEQEFGDQPIDSSDFAASEPVSSAGFDMGDPAAFSSAAVSVTPTAVSAASSPYEPRYSGGAVWGLMMPCVLFLAIAGMMLYDLIRNMWSWTAQSSVLTSPIMEPIASMLGLK